MTTISGAGSSAWSSISNLRPARPPSGMDPTKMKEELFAKVDADGSGTVDKTELEDVQWFSRQEAADMLLKRHPRDLSTPPPLAIAYHIIRAWVEGKAFGGR